MNKSIAGITISDYIKKYPLMKDVIHTKEVFWLNPKYTSTKEALKSIDLQMKDILDAENRLKRFAPYIESVFPETKPTNGIIESPLKETHHMKKVLENASNTNFNGKFFIKCDSHLPISGSIKARGGIYEVLKHAETLAIHHNLLTIHDDYSILASEKFRQFFSKFSIAVGSTGNLGLSIGIMSAKLGFNVSVHMSADAKEWKKQLLRSKGVNVIEYKSDYSVAVANGRKEAETDPTCYFIDDENSKNLFLGYAVAASRLKKQLDEKNMIVDENNPLFVYLPCGVGGGPGGVAFGLKLIFGDYVHFFFVEPTHSPCMLIGLMTEKHEKVCVGDFGIDNITEADGLAVGRPSGFVGKVIDEMISGIYTIDDPILFKLLTQLADAENIYLEPSALSSVIGMSKLYTSKEGKSYIEKNKLQDVMKNSIHIAWATGGSMVPKDIMEGYYQKGLSL